jgi:RND family efflux transporter MFP subunit
MRHSTAAGLLACLLWLGTGCSNTPGAAPAGTVPPSAPTTVVVAKVQRRQVVRMVELPADVVPMQQTMIYAKVAGYIDTMHVDKGDRVQAGQLLAHLTLPEAVGQVAQHRADVSKGEADLAAARADVPAVVAQQRAAMADYQRAVAQEQQLRTQIKSSQAALQQAKAEQQLAQQSYDRLVGVAHIDAGLVAGEDLDTARTALAVARSKTEAARQNVSAALRQVQVAHAQSAVARAQAEAQSHQVSVAQARAASMRFQREANQAAQQEAQATLDYADIRAPFSGIITNRFLDRGALAQSATTNAQTTATPMFSIADVDTVRVIAHAPESEAPYVHKGVRATVQADYLGSERLTETVTRTSNVLDPSTRTLLTEVDLPNPSHRLQAGTVVRMTLAVQAHDNALAVPAAALVTEKKQSFVFVVSEGKARKVPITPGFANDEWVEINAGLHGNEDVVISGNEHLNNDAAVRIVPAAKP